MQIGKKKIIKDAVLVGSEYLELAKKDEEAAIVLYKNGLYNQSIFFYIQSMEKYIKYHISKEININNKFFANQFREIGHSLDKAIDLLIEIKSKGDEFLNKILCDQLKEKIFRGLKFSGIYNNVRYPFYSIKFENYTMTQTSKTDCNIMQEIYDALKLYLKELIRI